MNKKILAGLAIYLAASGASGHAAILSVETAFSDEFPGCWVRVYDDSHLRSHATQTVRQINSRLYSYQDEDRKMHRVLEVQAILLHGQNYATSLSCINNSLGMLCSLTGRGSVQLTLKRDGKPLKLINNGLTLVETKTPGRDMYLNPDRGGDDVFDLSSASDQDCIGVMGDEQPQN